MVSSVGSATASGLGLTKAFALSRLGFLRSRCPRHGGQRDGAGGGDGREGRGAGEERAAVDSTVGGLDAHQRLHWVLMDG